ncbi:P-loop containing nucleoside triphosphate hydrolase protein [Halteromyces radiatus]|uniref:P-loop containing nucleoside triphosphate hydrolase protein n=1 Tax=Halteromyces radiatus TaxID=101107 RepID=UPI002220716F|nr:P-loop containing nucleoside triphosphate hydrolase protein [Halteromyces radiatus]KAI8093452.1 P-loop containing nucleoside triphosphate hydrolase protein [Halteromyces radiatus]
MVTPPLSQQLDLYSKDTKVWFADDKEGWVSATCISKHIDDKVTLLFQNDIDNSKEHIFEATYKELEKNNGSTLPPLRNPNKLESTDDLTSLSYLNEPSVLHTIRKRYDQKIIYTYSGIVLIATNPFDRVSLYEPDIIQKYSGSRRGDLDPHLFAIAEDAYRCMIRQQQNQTIIVSGESGAGKTVSAKYIMRYFATADDKEATGKLAKNNQGMTEVEEQILATNPIMEAFGNAKTTRNDNSSRFGKYIEIQFDKECNIIGAKIKTYLLERSRLIYQPETERNYHIFYQLCSGLPSKEKQQLGLKNWSDYHYLNQSGAGTIPGVDDAEEFELTQQSLIKVGISKDIQTYLFQLLAALLHMGNIDITGRGDAMIAEDDPSLLMTTKLLGIKTSDFRKWIVRRQITTRSEKIVTNLSPTQAQVVRDSVAKHIYAHLFDWLVDIVNDTLSSSSPESVATFIGVLDIYGFEHFKKNSFEQFCINYANEKLQQQFNQHVFKLEQEEYVREEINWKFIEFSDNQKCIEMIEAKMGILSLLDEESRLPSGTDQAFCNKLYQTFASPPYQDYFKKPRFSNSSFTVVHYAHDVQYEAEGFMDKNKDTVPDEHLALLQGAEFNFLVDMLQENNSSNSGSDSPTNSPKRLSLVKKPTLGSIFKLSLISLMDTIGQTNVHYIRCIKPNEAKAAWQFEPNMVLAQLRACGVLETIRISCSGYPTRWTFSDFVDRYYVLVPSDQWRPRNKADERKLCGAILDTHVTSPDRYQIGLTKIFFRAGQLAYMEKLRTDRWSEVAILLQKNMRRYMARLKYKQTLGFILKLQQVARKKHGRALLHQLRQDKAATVIQSYWRMYVVRKAFLERRAFIIKLQTAVRSVMAKKHFSMVRKHNAATQIQSLVRGWMVRRLYQTKRQFVIRIQSCVRRRQARKQLVVIKAEARSVSHFKEVSYKLETRVVELTQSLTRQKEEKGHLKEKATELEEQVRNWIEKYDQLDQRAKQLDPTTEDEKTSSTTTTDNSNKWHQWHQERQGLEQEYFTSLNKIKHQDKEIERLRDELTKQKNEMTKLRDTSQKAVQSLADIPNVSELKSQIAALKSQLSHTLNRQPHRTIKQPSTHNGTTALHQQPENNKDEISSNELFDIDTQVSQDLHTLLLDEQTLHKEIYESLIRLSITDPTTRDINGDNGCDAKSEKQVTTDDSISTNILFPAHIIDLCLVLMWKLGDLVESEQFIFSTIDVIRKHCQEQHGDDVLAVYLYWLTNAHELLSLVFIMEPLKTSTHQHAVDKVVNKVKYELQRLQMDLFGQVMKEIHIKLNKMAVAAVIESQCLPGFLANDTGRLFNNNQAAAFTMDDLIRYFDHVIKLIEHYQLEISTKEQIVNEMIKYVGVTCFNDMVMRRNYNSWKRAMQVQYNLVRLEEWCQAQNMSDATLELEYLTQTTKLLQLKKNSLDDIQIIYDVCWTLSPTQIQKLMQNYHVAEYEEPISHEILRVVSAKATSHDNKQLLLDATTDQTIFELPQPRTVVRHSLVNVDLKLDLPHVQRLLVLVSNEKFT